MALIGLATMLGGAQQRPVPAPQEQDRSVVVIAPDDMGIDTAGPEPRLRGGEWRFERSTTLGSGDASNVAVQRIPSTGAGSGLRFGFSACLPDDSLAGALQQLAGDRSSMPNPSQLCGRLMMDVKDGSIGGRRSCLLRSLAIGRSHSKLSLRLSGRYDRRDLKLNIYGEEQTDGLAEERSVPRPATYRWQVTAHRVGDCSANRARLRSLDEAADLLFIPGADGSGI
ncbi:hypothetical protein [Sphingomonas aracearum]|uniref:hypothetical protein n=1 Tax=Sphingomonas aracearum TaxID=2283317 RepID=UPI0011C01EEE|nr:hypothetical protein [Sphingomonas aracearum]